MSKVTQSVRPQKLIAKLVPRSDFEAAQSSALVLAKFGVTMVPFSNERMMDDWVKACRNNHGLTIQVLKEKEVPHV